MANFSLSDEEWELSRPERDHLARNLDLVLNFPRLISCLRAAQEACRNGETSYKILHESMRARARDNATLILDFTMASLRT